MIVSIRAQIRAPKVDQIWANYGLYYHTSDFCRYVSQYRVPLLAVKEIEYLKLAACSRRRELHEQVHDLFVGKLVQRAAALSKKKHIWPTAEQRLISMRELVEGGARSSRLCLFVLGSLCVNLDADCFCGATEEIVSRVCFAVVFCFRGACQVRVPEI